MKQHRIRCILITAALIFFIIVPVVTVFLKAVIADDRLDLMNAVRIIADSGSAETIGNSLLLGVLVVLVSTLLATPLAFLLSRTRFARYTWLDIVFMIPFMTPPYIASMGWILFVQKRGLFQQMFPWTGRISEKFFSLAGLVLVMSFHSYPFLTTILKNAILNLSGSLEEGGQIAGAGFWYRLRKITLPLLTGNYAIGMLLVFVKTLSEYGTPATLGNRIGFYVFTTDIHRYASTAPIDFGKAAALSSVLVVICMAMWMLQTWITNTHTYQLVGTRGGHVPGRRQRRSVTVAGAVYIAFLILVSIGIPYFSVIVSSLINRRGYGMQSGNFTLSHYAELFTSDNKALRALISSAGMAVLTASIVSLAGTFIVFSVRNSGKWKTKIEGLALFPEMIPNIVLVIGLMIFWNRMYKVAPLYNTVGFMVLVYSTMFLPYSIQYVSSSLMQIGDNLLAAGRVAGASEHYIMRRITIPLVAKGIFTGWMMTFIITFRELVASSLIAPPGILTVSTFILSEFEQGTVSAGMAMAVICTGFTTTALLIMNGLMNRRMMPDERKNGR